MTTKTDIFNKVKLSFNLGQLYSLCKCTVQQKKGEEGRGKGSVEALGGGKRQGEKEKVKKEYMK